MIKRLLIVCILLIGAVSSIVYFQQKQPRITPSFILPSQASKKEKQEWTLIATGDVIPARSVNAQTIKRHDFTWAWKNIAPILQEGDITLINLESPLLQNCPVTEEGMKFCGDAKHVEGLLFSGVDVASIANNHAGNYGIEGVNETIELLRKNNIQVIGGDTQPVVKRVQNMNIGFLAYNDIGYTEEGIAWADEETMKKEIEETKKQCDVVIVSMSWGVEYTRVPSERQQTLAHLIIDSGADVVIGNHPHWIQSVEKYKEGYIMYAHGNTIFDQMWSEETKIGVIGKYTFSGNKLTNVEFIPTYIKDYGQPMLLTGQAKEDVLRQF